MTPARQELLRLALEMPDEGIATCARAMIWICPDLARAELTAGEPALEPIGQFYELAGRLPADMRAPFLRTLRKLAECYAAIAAERAPKPARLAGNVVELFSAKRG